MDLSRNFLLGRTLKKANNLFLKSYILLNLELRTKMGFPNIQLTIFLSKQGFLNVLCFD